MHEQMGKAEGGYLATLYCIGHLGALRLFAAATFASLWHSAIRLARRQDLLHLLSHHQRELRARALV